MKDDKQLEALKAEIEELKEKNKILLEERDAANRGGQTTLNAFNELKRVYLSGEKPNLLGF